MRIRDIASNPASSTLASLSINLDDCAKDIIRWLAVAQTHPLPTDSKVKKFLLGIKAQNVKDLIHEISNHRHGLSLALSATGRYVVKIL